MDTLFNFVRSLTLFCPCCSFRFLCVCVQVYVCVILCSVCCCKSDFLKFRDLCVLLARSLILRMRKLRAYKKLRSLLRTREKSR